MCLSPVCYWKKATALTEVMGSVGGQLGSLSARLRFLRTFFMADTCWPTRVTRRAVSMERSSGKSAAVALLSRLLFFHPSNHNRFSPFLSVFRQNPVPEKSRARCGHEATALHRRLLQGKAQLTVGVPPKWLLHRFHMGHMAKAPQCLFTRLKHKAPARQSQPAFAVDEVRV